MNINGIFVFFMMLFALSLADAKEPDPLYWLPLRTRAHADQAKVYKTVDGEKLYLRLYFPPKHEPKKDRRPAIVVIHGGGWTSPGAKRWAPFCRYFARRGMVTVNVQYRLADREPNVRMDDCLADSRDAFRYVHKNADKLGIDPERIVIAGESAGGQLAAATAMVPESDAKKSDLLSQTDAILLYGACLDLTDLGWLSNHAALAPTHDTPEDESWKQRGRALSPINYVTDGLPPMLIMHGQKDEVVPVEQIDRFVKKARKAGTRVNYQRMPEWGHAFSVAGSAGDKTVVKSIRITDRFLSKHDYIEGKPRIARGWEPPDIREPMTKKERAQPHIVGRSFDLDEWPFLDGQWEGIIYADDGNVYFGVSSHDRMHHAHLFRYLTEKDRVEHLANLGKVCGEYGEDIPTQDKIHADMFDAGKVIYTGTCDGHASYTVPYGGGHWIEINKKTGKVRSLGKSITGDGLITIGYDRANNLLYTNTNHKGLLSVFDPEKRKERIIGSPWKHVSDLWTRSLNLMIPPGRDGKVYAVCRPRASIWEYDPDGGSFRVLDIDQPVPKEIQKSPGDEKLQEKWRKSGGHITVWSQKDECYYFIRSFDEALCRFYPPEKDGGSGRVEVERLMRPEIPRRYGNRHPACTLVIHDRTVYYTPYTGWGGETHLVSYDLDTQKYKHYGPIVVEKGRRVNECHSMAGGPDGKLYLVAFVFSIPGEDLIRPNAMRGPYPFHPRLVILNP